MDAEVKVKFLEVYEILKGQNELNKELTKQTSLVYEYALTLEKRIIELERRLDTQEDYEREMRENE